MQDARLKKNEFESTKDAARATLTRLLEEEFPKTHERIVRKLMLHATEVASVLNAFNRSKGAS